ncbi:unnamed protein product, partial [Candidula unifasciata]
SVNDYDRRQGQPTSSLGVWSRQAVPNSNYVPNGGTHQDVSVNPASIGDLNYRTHPVRNGLTAHNSTHSDPHNTAVPSETNRQGHQNSLVMNIPPSLQEQRIKNTEIPIANAEQQPSFHSLPTVVSDLSPISRNAETQYDTYPSQVLPSLKPPSFGTVSPQGQPMFSLGAPCVSSEDNFHMSLSPNMGHHGRMGQAGERQVPSWHNNFNGISYMGNSATPGSCGRQISHSSSASSLRSFISDNCLVKKLSWKILRHVALTLQCKHSSASWKDLVERYGWDYERTYLFENKPHPEGIFFSLLLEPEFQDYSLEQLREDLFELPRRDILSDLNKLILEHNASASGGATRQNQFP